MFKGCLNRHSLHRFSLHRHSLLPCHASMMFLCVINFDLLRNLKESLLVTRIGAEAIPFIKLWVVMPAALVFVFCYGFLANRLTKSRLFVVCMVPFLVWMPLFTFYLYPNLEALKPTLLCEPLYQWLPESLSVIGGLLEFWPLTLLFCSAELWGTGVLCTLFWTCVNDTSSVESSAKHYPWLSLLGNSASLLSGPVIWFLVDHQAGQSSEGWERSLVYLSVLYVLCGLAIIGLYFRIIRRSSELRKAVSAQHQDQPTATMLSFKDSFTYLFRSRYLRNIAIIMVGYCISINMLEVAWKSQLVRIYPTAYDYSIFMAKLSMYYGVGAILAALTTAGLLRLGWKIAALATPVLMVVTGLPFTLMIILSNCGWLPEAYSAQTFLLGVAMGTACNVISKSAKYTLFDGTKEMAFVPLDNEQKIKGKAAIEMVISRAGKSSSALMQQCLIVVFGSLAASMQWIAGIVLVVVLAWLASVCALARQYTALRHEALHHEKTISSPTGEI